MDNANINIWDGFDTRNQETLRRTNIDMGETPSENVDLSLNQDLEVSQDRF